MSYKYFSSIRRCSCPKKFQGEHCEIGMGIQTWIREAGEDRRSQNRDRWVGCRSRQRPGLEGLVCEPST